MGSGFGCLFCRASAGPFTGREHPFPESLGKTEVVLPRGVVCDRCNNGPLATLDQAICEFLPVQMHRTMLGVRSKGGVVPRTRCSTGVVENTGPGSLRFQPTGRTSMLRETSRVGDSTRLRFELQGGKRLTPRYGALLSRALLKTGLELAWLDHGEMMFESRFDHVRDAVLGQPFPGFLAVAQTGDPNQVSVSLTYNLLPVEDEWRIPVVASYYGVPLVTDSRLAEPPVPIDEEAIVVTFGPRDAKAA